MLAPTLLMVLLQPVAEGPAALAQPVQTDVRAGEWAAEGRRIKIHAGLSWGFAGAMALTGMLLVAIPSDCGTFNDVCGASPGRTITGVTMLALATIPVATGIVWGVRLSQHNRYRPTMVLRPRVGGFVVNF